MENRNPKFTDKQGRTWPLELTVHLRNECRKYLDVDLFDFGDPQGTTFKAFADPMLVCELAYALADCERNGVTSEDFAAAMNGEAIEAAANALVDALKLFFRNARRQTAAQLMASDPELANLMGAVALTLIDLQVPPKRKSGSTNAPESLESTPALTV